MFQLTTSRRGRLTTWIHSWHLDCFNSRPHEEVDVSFAGYRSAASGVSTHDLTKRSTLSMRQSVMRLTFQLTTSRRGRLSISVIDLVALMFQLTTSRRGRRVPTTAYINQSNMFQLTTSRRGRLTFFNVIIKIFMFQLTTSRRGRRFVSFSQK